MTYNTRCAVCHLLYFVCGQCVRVKKGWQHSTNIQEDLELNYDEGAAFTEEENDGASQSFWESSHMR